MNWVGIHKWIFKSVWMSFCFKFGDIIHNITNSLIEQTFNFELAYAFQIIKAIN